jgi:hypothetical protein
LQTKVVQKIRTRAVYEIICNNVSEPERLLMTVRLQTGPPGWGFGVGLTTPHSKKLIVTKHLQA